MPLAGGHKGARSWLRGRVVLEVIALHPSHTSRDLTQFHPLQPFAAQTYSRMLWILQQQPLYLAQLSQYIKDEARPSGAASET